LKTVYKPYFALTNVASVSYQSATVKATEVVKLLQYFDKHLQVSLCLAFVHAIMAV